MQVKSLLKYVYTFNVLQELVPGLIKGYRKGRAQPPWKQEKQICRREIHTRSHALEMLT